MAVTDEIVAHLYVLPWLRLQAPIRFGRVTVAPADTCLVVDHACTPAGRRILACYQGLGGDVVAPNLMWMTDGDPLGLTDVDFADLVRHRMCLSMGLIAGNEYYNTVGIGGVTDAHCDGFFHRFSADTTHVGFYKRRREGVNADGWPLTLIRMPVPLSASPQHQVNLDQELLDALVATITKKTALGKALDRAIPPFLQGNRLSEQTTVLDDLVWMGSAFERLLGATSPGIGRKLADAITVTLAGFTEVTSNWDNETMAGKLEPDSGPWRRRWMREFYVRRSALHGGDSRPSTWDDISHTVIAAEVFSLAIKQLLAQAGEKTLTNSDLDRLDALDDRIEKLAGSSVPGNGWNDALKAAIHRRVVAGATADLEEAAVAE
jgi:hypothetical protein